MADVTIGQLNSGIPSKNSAIIPFSDGSTTYKTAPSGIVAASPGSVLKVVNAVLTSPVTTTSSSYVSTGLSVSITPTSLNSKILVMLTGIATSSDIGGSQSLFKIIRNKPTANTDVDNQSTQSLGGDVACAVVEGNLPGYPAYPSNNPGTSSRNRGSINCTLLDSPNSASLVTYTLMFKNYQGAATALLGRWSWDTNWSTPTTLTLMEIAG